MVYCHLYYFFFHQFFSRDIKECPFHLHFFNITGTYSKIGSGTLKISLTKMSRAVVTGTFVFSKYVTDTLKNVSGTFIDICYGISIQHQVILRVLLVFCHVKKDKTESEKLTFENHHQVKFGLRVFFDENFKHSIFFCG